MPLVSNRSELPRLTIAELAPRPTDRALIVGQTGSGKTTLAKELIRDAVERRGRHVVAVDFKGTLKLPGFETFTSLKKLTASKGRTLLYRPTYAETQDTAMQSRFWEWVYRRKHTTIYVDETAAVTAGEEFHFYYGAVLMRGRELGLELWSATQRPKRIPQIVLSESEHVYAFRLRLPQDRERVEQLTSLPAERIADLPKRYFLYAPQDGEIAGPLTLDLRG